METTEILGHLGCFWHWNKQQDLSPGQSAQSIGQEYYQDIKHRIPANCHYKDGGEQVCCAMFICVQAWRSSAFKMNLINTGNVISVGGASKWIHELWNCMKVENRKYKA